MHIYDYRREQDIKLKQAREAFLSDMREHVARSVADQGRDKGRLCASV